MTVQYPVNRSADEDVGRQLATGPRLPLLAAAIGDAEFLPCLNVKGQGFPIRGAARISAPDAGPHGHRALAVPSRTTPLLTFQAAAERCAVSIWTVRAWVDAGRLKAIRLPGRLVRIDSTDLDRFIEACR
jgi:excisionase family DNA binding protein